MESNKYFIDQLNDCIKKDGIQCLLPQNLTDEILDRMILEAHVLDTNMTDNTPPSTIFKAILQLELQSKVISDGMRFEIDVDKLSNYLNYYIASIRIEDLRRHKVINLPEDSLPTVDNIFDKNRVLELEVQLNNGHISVYDTNHIL